MSAVTSCSSNRLRVGYTPAERHFVEAFWHGRAGIGALRRRSAVYDYAGAQLRFADSALAFPVRAARDRRRYRLDETDALVRPGARPHAPGAFVNAAVLGVLG